MKQTIDISPANVGPIAAAGVRFLSLETTLVPGNLRQQLAVLEVFLSGLASGELVLATPTPAPVESDSTGGEDSDKKGPTPEELQEILGGPTGTSGEGQGG